MNEILQPNFAKESMFVARATIPIEDRGIPQMTAICRYVGCSDQEAIRLTSGAVNYLVNKPLGKYVIDQGALRERYVNHMF